MLFVTQGSVSGVCVRGVCRGHSEELSTIKQSGHNVKPSDLLSNPCLTELYSTPKSVASGTEEQGDRSKVRPWVVLTHSRRKKKSLTLQERPSFTWNFEIKTSACLH